MKKLILTLSLLLCATTSSLLSMVMHTPAPGQIQLGGLPSFDPNGTIMTTILRDPNFEEERNAIKTFLQSTTINQNYQSIVSAINNAPANMPGALESLEAFERAIMNYIHSENYIVTVENKWLNIFVTGIRWNWVNPKRWLQPSYWFSDNSQILQLCMQELSTLASIATKHSIITSNRMKATIESYLHWRRNLATIIATYFAANLVHHGWQKSSLKMLKNGAWIKNNVLDKVMSQAGKDIVDFTKYSSTTIYNGAKAVTSLVKPMTDFILYGDQDTTPKKSTCEVNDDTESWYSNLKHNFKTYNRSIYDKFFDEKKKNLNNK